MKNYISFRLHNGNVPYFVDKFFSISPISGKYYGISKDSACCYIPDTLLLFTADEFKTAIVNNCIIYKTIDDEQVEMNHEEMGVYIDQWIADDKS